MKIGLHPGAQRDLEEAALFYEREGSAAVAARFVAEFRRVSLVLVEHPEIGAPRSRGRRGFSLRVFPYTVIYRVGETEITVLVVKHDRKRPGFGGSRSWWR
jgi:plasmid stabilization system protein ParE